MGLWSVGGTTTSFQLGGVALFSKTVLQKMLGLVSHYRFELRLRCSEQKCPDINAHNEEFLNNHLSYTFLL